MTVRRLLFTLTPLLILCLSATPAPAETVTEVWRGGGFDGPHSVSVNPTDGSCWVADYYHNQVVHLAEDGAELWRGGGFSLPRSVSVNATDSSCWVADGNNDDVVHLAEDGSELSRAGGDVT